jgi:hypothetical protein
VTEAVSASASAWRASCPAAVAPQSAWPVSPVSRLALARRRRSGRLDALARTEHRHDLGRVVAAPALEPFAVLPRRVDDLLAYGRQPATSGVSQ